MADEDLSYTAFDVQCGPMDVWNGIGDPSARAPLNRRQRVNRVNFPSVEIL